MSESKRAHSAAGSGYGRRVAERLRTAARGGRLVSPDAVGEAGSTACGSLVRIELAQHGNRIAAVRYQAYGCPATIACAEEVAAQVEGRSLWEAARVGEADIRESLGLAVAYWDRAATAIDALHEALGRLLAAETAPRPKTVVPGTLVGMSGGVDSSVAALLLRERGLTVAGVTLRLWSPSEDAGDKSCCSPAAVRRARLAAHNLGIPHFTVDAVSLFGESVVEYFVAEYAAGRTPNPCAKCNARLRFPLLRNLADRLGLAWVGTGHYARLTGEPPRLARGRDRRKDQSYVLAEVDPSLLERCVFPLGEMTKRQVRHLAAERGIVGYEAPESQEICFIPDNNYRRFLRTRLGDRPGLIVDTQGEMRGRHRGTYGFTVGQRRGLGIAAGRPLYVVAVDAAERRVVVGDAEELRVAEVQICNLTWHRVPVEQGAGGAVQGQLQFRSTGEARAARLLLSERASGGAPLPETPSERATVIFDEPAYAVAPGQTAVFYVGDEVVVAGTIDAALPPENSVA